MKPYETIVLELCTLNDADIVRTSPADDIRDDIRDDPFDLSNLG